MGETLRLLYYPNPRGASRDPGWSSLAIAGPPQAHENPLFQEKTWPLTRSGWTLVKRGLACRRREFQCGWTWGVFDSLGHFVGGGSTDDDALRSAVARARSRPRRTD